MSSPLLTDLPPFRLRDRELLPIVQGGMGVGISGHRLAGTVAAHGAMERSQASICAVITMT